MTSSIPVPALIDDEATLNQLTMSPTPSVRKSKQQGQSSNANVNESQTQHIPPLSLTLNSFQSLSSRFIEDVSSPICGLSHSQFWNDLLSSAKSLGFSYSETNKGDGTNTAAAVSAASFDDNSSSINFDSNEGKSHLDAVTSLLGVSTDAAKFLTVNVLERMKKDTSSSNSSSNESSISTPSSSSSTKGNSLVGTKKLLLLVRDYHYQQQISRIRFVTESLRHEAASNGNDKVQSSCITFLDTFDERTTINESKRGLFKLLLSIACAPVHKLQRDEWHKCLYLTGTACTSSNNRPNDDPINDNIHPTSVFHSSLQSKAHTESRESQNYFCKNLNERHEIHYGSTLRIEALEAIFMLLYNRIDGGINRSDYILLLLAFDQQGFFVRDDVGNVNTVTNASSQQQRSLSNTFAFKYAKRQNQLVALILAECMSLWHAIKCSQMSESSSNELIDTHPFFAPSTASSSGHGDHRSILKEITSIGRLLLQKFAVQAEVRIQRNFEVANMNYISNNDTKYNQRHDENHIRGDIDVPESIAILTFGVLIKMGYDSSPTSNWLAEAEIIDISSKCVSVANDVIGAFDYLLIVVRDFLTAPTRMRKLFETKNDFDIEEKTYEFALLFKEEQSADIDSRKPEYKHIFEDEDESIVSYASIGREILVGTLTAFRGSISTSTSLETITMLCNLASMIYRNDDQMCSQFWSDWSTISEANCNSIEDPMNQLLYITYEIANDVITEDIFLMNESSNRVRSAISALPALRPFLQFFSSLITADGNYSFLDRFLSNGIVYVSLLGSYYLCTFDENSYSMNTETKADSLELLEASASVMKSLNLIADMIQEGDIQRVTFLRSALAPSQSGYTHGCELLHKLALSANMKLSNQNQTDVRAQHFASIVASCLSVMSSLINQSQSEDLIWIECVTSCLTLEPNLIKSSSSSRFRDLRLIYFELIHNMSRSTLHFMTTKTTSPKSRGDFLQLMNDGANTAFEMILNNDLSSSQGVLIIYHSISTLDLLLKHLDITVRVHNNSEIQDSARILRNSIIDLLCNSTKLGYVIGNLAVKPAISSPHGLLKKQIKKRTSEDQDNENIADHSVAHQLRNNLASTSSENTTNICAASIALLSTWIKVAEHIAIENVLPLKNKSLDEIIETLQPDLRSMISSELNAKSPVCLLFCAMQTSSTSNGNKGAISLSSDANTPLLSLLSRYLGWNIEHSKSDLNSKYFAYQSLTILDSCLRQFYLVKENYQYTEQCLRAIGNKLVHTLECQMNNFDGIEEANRLTDMLYLLDILTSYLYLQPDMLKDIIENFQERNFVDNLIARLRIRSSSSLNELIFASYCGKFLRKFFQESRKGIICEKIVENLLASESSLLVNLQTDDGITLHHLSASYVLQVLSYQMDIITFEFLQGDREQISGVEGKMRLLSQTLFQRFCSDLCVNIANGTQSFNQLISTSQTEISIDKQAITYSSIKALDGMYGLDFASEMKSLQICQELLASQTQFITTFRVLFTLFDTSSYSDPYEQVMQVVKLHLRLMQNYSLALPVLSSLSNQKVTDFVIDFSKALSGYVVVALANGLDKSPKSPILILDSLMDLSNYGLESIQPSSMSVELYDEFRSNTILSASLVIEALMETNYVLTTDNRKRYNQLRVKCCRLLCDTLEWLCHHRVNFRNESKSACLLQSTLNCMNLLAQQDGKDAKDQDSTFLLTQMYQTHLLDTLSSSNAIPLLIIHLETASDLVTKSVTSTVDCHYDVITSILNLVDSLLQLECSYEVSQLLVDHHFITSLINNPILRSANMDSFSTACFRGYTKSQNSQHAHLLPERDTLEKDPKHEIWCSVLRVVASFASSTNKMGRIATTSIIDFLKTYMTNIESVLHYFKYAHHQEFSLGIGTKSDRQFGFSLSFLRESCDILAIISELSSGLHRKQFSALSLQELLKDFHRHSMYVIRSLSSFLGSIGTAREIFNLLNEFESVKDKDEDEILSALYKKFASHPLLLEGIDKGRYEAFRFSQYANNCCICVTSEEHALSRKIRGNEQGRENIHSQVQNEFLLLMESIASKCLFNALSTASKNHSASSSLVLFDATEANQLNACSLLEPGSIVAIRSKLSCQNETLSKLTNKSHQRFARVLSCDGKTKTFSVSYINGHGSLQEENNLNMSRIEGIEDPARRIACFRYESAKESCDQKQYEQKLEQKLERTSGNADFLVATIGHLIQVLQWCRQCNVDISQRSNQSSKSGLLSSIAEMTMVLIGNDLSLHHEIHSQRTHMPVPNKGEIEKIQEQLLSLFDEVDDLSVLQQQSKNGLKQVVNQSIWDNVVNTQLSSTLVVAKARDKEMIQNRDQDHYAYYGSDETLWSPKLSRRRSPFK